VIGTRSFPVSWADISM